MTTLPKVTAAGKLSRMADGDHWSQELDEIRHPWRTPRLPELVGAVEACEIMGVQKMTLYRWLRPGSGTLGPDRTYMIPPKRIRASPVWVKEDVERFVEEKGRQRAPMQPQAKKNSRAKRA